MLNQEFRNLLEYRLTAALAESTTPELRRYWCDGVLEPEWEADYLPEHVAHSQRIVLRAWMEGAGTTTAPKTHQLHPLLLALGPASLKAYLERQELLHWIQGD
jgi:hypothetical protein